MTLSSGKCVLPARTDMNFDLQVLRVCKLVSGCGELHVPGFIKTLAKQSSSFFQPCKRCLPRLLDRTSSVISVSVEDA